MKKLAVNKYYVMYKNHQQSINMPCYFQLDALCTRRQDVLYSIMEWAAHNTALLTVLAVANTMDLPERALAARVASRLGLTRLTFPPYTHIQLQNIVATRLSGANVTADAVQLIARYVC